MFFWMSQCLGSEGGLGVRPPSERSDVEPCFYAVFLFFLMESPFKAILCEL